MDERVDSLSWAEIERIADAIRATPAKPLANPGARRYIGQALAGIAMPTSSRSEGP